MLWFALSTTESKINGLGMTFDVPNIAPEAITTVCLWQFP